MNVEFSSQTSNMDKWRRRKLEPPSQANGEGSYFILENGVEWHPSDLIGIGALFD
jgi:hypothetical protein